MNIHEAEMIADELIVAELAKQNAMWGQLNGRSDVSESQLMHAGMAQLDALFDRHNGEPDPFSEPPAIFPEGWSGFRDYGSDVANLVVAVAYLMQEIKRRIFIGEDTTRLSRTADQPYSETSQQLMPAFS